MEGQTIQLPKEKGKKKSNSRKNTTQKIRVNKMTKIE
jgi:hypothetical protein